MLSLHITNPPGRALRILCLGAHADDIEIGCAGTLLTLLRSRPCIVRWVVFSACPTRRSEAEAAASDLLAHAAEASVSILDHRDSYFPYRGAAVKDDVQDLKPFEPDLVFTHHRDDRHQDHRLLAELTWNTFRNHLILEYEIPKYDGELGNPNLYVPLSNLILERKIQLLLDRFPSQRHHHWFDAATFQALARLRGLECNSPTRLAEAFLVRKLLWDPSPSPQPLSPT
ncbi:MAG: GlcNAc-PI de-N-acetylase [Isosphaeraceae bacterium]|jgi:LmbE family N-acetylglucosaminyl deacetylase|nr:MAG: GlcNAc-PI de-N-acetylase [Isosphaeraceae bacterium]